MRSLVVPAPAKLNLFLHVTGRRPDGYHTLESLFVAIDLCDTVELSLRDDGAIVRTAGLANVAPEQDLAIRAAAALRTECGSAPGADIGVVKRIPVGAGLGGGSSDAASVLLGLNRLWDLGLSRDALARIATSLGADVPFFVRGESALARGIGDVLTPVSLPLRWIALVVPDTVVPTAGIFAASELTRDTPSAKIDVFSEGYGRNDLQPVAAARYPEIATALDALRAREAGARMTGSGSGVYAVFGSEAEARAAVDARPAATQGYVVRTLARHPLATFE